MRIQNNITAMNTHRMYTINNDNVAKSAEKLSSGYRINRAGDDAAGLAISEKMRSQIRGLNMATKNSQDAISLVQTAEGALQETHSMLQRMNELAVQAATGTNEDFDRSALAKEFNQLKREINDVAEQTTFNNMKILDGSMSYEGYVRSAQTAGVSITASEQPDPAKAVKPNQVSEGKAAAAAVAGAQGTVSVALGGTISVAAGTPAKITFTYDGQDYDLQAADGAASNAADAAALFDGKKVTIDGIEFVADGTTTAGTIKLTASTEADFVGTGTGAITIKTMTGGIPSANATLSGTNGATAKDAVTASTDKWTAELTPSSFKVGDEISIGDGTKSYTITKADLALSEDALMDKLVTELNDTAVKVTRSGNTLVAESQTNPPQDTDKDTAKINFTPNPATASTESYKNTIELDTAKMKKGDKFTFTVGGETKDITFDPDKHFTDADKTAAERMAEELAGKFTTAAVSAKGNALIFTGAKVNESDIVLTDATKGANASDYPTNAIRIQVGALEDEQLAVSIDAMNTAGLGLDGFNLDSQNEAGMAITATRDAINKVSDQRATLGAMQNRLDHKIANLKVSSENLSAAESRIRDVDMASEMTNFTKNNILSQAATAMLAQANALPQNVLSLLG